jgi:acyl-CoA synthetase (AMP-forming)/AMP-acid ligase II
MRVVDDGGNQLPRGAVGEITIRGHNVMKGYWQRPDATAEAIGPGGWFKTGDMAKVDQDGYSFIVDRKKELVIRGGGSTSTRARSKRSSMSIPTCARRQSSGSRTLNSAKRLWPPSH